MNMNSTYDILNAEAVAARLRGDGGTGVDHSRPGVLPALKFGRSWIYPRAALMQRLVELALERAKPGRGSSDTATDPPVAGSKSSRLKPKMVAAAETHSGARLRRRAAAPTLPSPPDDE